MRHTVSPSKRADECTRKFGEVAWKFVESSFVAGRLNNQQISRSCGRSKAVPPPPSHSSSSLYSTVLQYLPHCHRRQSSSPTGPLTLSDRQTGRQSGTPKYHLPFVLRSKWLSQAFGRCPPRKLTQTSHTCTKPAACTLAPQEHLRCEAMPSSKLTERQSAARHAQTTLIIAQPVAPLRPQSKYRPS